MYIPDDIALAYQDEDIEETEHVLTSDLEILAEYFKTWKLQPNPAKTEVSVFHLNNRHANYKLNISFDGTPLTHNEFPKYLGVTLDRSLSYRAHIKKTAAKVSARANIVQKLAGTSWGGQRKSSAYVIVVLGLLGSRILRPRVVKQCSCKGD